MKKTTTYTLIVTALMAALMCIAGPNSILIPMSPVPISFTTLAIFISAFVLGKKMCTVSTVIYLLLGLVGLPVFSGYSGGFGKFAGPTGGYLIGFIFTAFITGFFIEKFGCKIYTNVIGMILGLGVAYLFGTLWFTVIMNTTFVAALASCVVPFLIGDAIKIIIGAILGPILRKSLMKAGLIA